LSKRGRAYASILGLALFVKGFEAGSAEEVEEERRICKERR